MSHGIKLLLPVAELRSKSEVQTELESYGITRRSMELKCSKQVIDPGLTGDALRETVDQGIEALRVSLQSDRRSQYLIETVVVPGQAT
jgi:hypothetical protein